MELHTRSTEANGFDGNARLGRTGHKERTPWLVGSVGFEGTMTTSTRRASDHHTAINFGERARLVATE